MGKCFRCGKECPDGQELCSNCNSWFSGKISFTTQNNNAKSPGNQKSPVLTEPPPLPGSYASGGTGTNVGGASTATDGAATGAAGPTPEVSIPGAVSTTPGGYDTGVSSATPGGYNTGVGSATPGGYDTGVGGPGTNVGTPPGNGSKKKLLPIIIAAAAVVLVGIVLLILPRNNKAGKTPKQTQGASTPAASTEAATGAAKDSGTAATAATAEPAQSDPLVVHPPREEATPTPVVTMPPATSAPVSETPKPTQEPAVPAQDAIYLYMLTPYDASNGTPGFRYFDNGRDNEGNWYSNSIGGYEEDTTNWCEYWVDGAYKTISGVVYLNYDHRDETARYAKMTITGDGKLLYTSSVITSGLVPQRFSVNIEGVRTLRMSIYGNEFVRVSDCILSASDSAGSVATPTTTPAPVPKNTMFFTEYTGNLTDYLALWSYTAAASSEIHYNGRVYGPINAIDGNLTTSWQEDADDDGVGEWLILYYDQPVTVDLMRFRLGYATYYERNGRPKTLSIEFSDGTKAQYTFPDLNRDIYLKLTKPVQTTSIKLTIEDVYKGTEFSDTCITEITAYMYYPGGGEPVVYGDTYYAGFYDLSSVVGQYATQFGEFREKEYALTYIEKIIDYENQKGNSERIFMTYRNGLYVTCLGPYQTKDEAVYHELLLKENGYDALAVLMR